MFEGGAATEGFWGAGGDGWGARVGGDGSVKSKRLLDGVFIAGLDGADAVDAKLKSPKSLDDRGSALGVGI